MAANSAPAAINFANSVCSSTGSGVVMPVLVKCGGKPTPRVPTMAQRGRAWASHQAVLVLPLVPVTATMRSACAGWPSHCAARLPVMAFRPVKLAMRASANAKSALPSCSTKQAAAPCAKAWATKARPSTAAPGQAIKISPGCTWRLSVRNCPWGARARNQAKVLGRSDKCKKTELTKIPRPDRRRFGAAQPCPAARP